MKIPFPKPKEKEKTNCSKCNHSFISECAVYISSLVLCLREQPKSGLRNPFQIGNCTWSQHVEYQMWFTVLLVPLFQDLLFLFGHGSSSYNAVIFFCIGIPFGSCYCQTYLQWSHPVMSIVSVGGEMLCSVQHSSLSL